MELQNFLASAIVRTIIEELNLPIEKKTFRPIDAGGIAGGEKYKAHDIFIKLALDSNGIYGGNEYSMKVRLLFLIQHFAFYFL